MKKIFTTTAVLALGALITFACKKSSSSTTTTTTSTTTSTNPTPTMAATYSAGIYSGTASVFTTSLTAVNQYGSQYGIQGSVVSNGQPLTIYLSAAIAGTGTVALGAQGSSNNYAQFIIDPTTTNTVTTTYATGYPTSSPGSGTLTVTDFNTTSRRISGSFSFTAGTASGGMATVTNGSFANVSY
ncbi:MAG TPA: hypothetical protein VN698_12195 [Bacteroidia bacterium]|nr:hypothetical protein [Bacteroidia bacterium]